MEYEGQELILLDPYRQRKRVFCPPPPVPSRFDAKPDKATEEWEENERNTSVMHMTYKGISRSNLTNILCVV